MMKKPVRSVILLAMCCMATGCSSLFEKPASTSMTPVLPVTPTANVGMSFTQTQTITPTLTPVIMGDFFFSSWAFLDVNGNGKWDETDKSVQGALMGLSIDGGKIFPLGGITDPDGCASVWAPGGNIETPFTVRMDPPEDSDLVPVGKSEVVYESGPYPRFLFREP